MSNYLITCTPAHGHVLPLVRIAQHLVDAGHRVRFVTSVRYAERVAASGAEFVALPADADVLLDDADAAFPERAGLRGPAALRFDISNLFVRPGAAQLAVVRALIAAEPVDAVITEPLFFGSALLQRLPLTERPPVVALGIFPLGAKSRDAAPFGLGIPPMSGPLGRIRNAALSVLAEKVIFGVVQREADAMSVRETGVPFDGFLLDWASGAEALIQFTVEAFEYPRSDLPDTVHFVGPLASTPSDGGVPDWWGDLDTDAPIVHVTQGTVANTDFDQLVRPTIAALADSDALVVVSTGGRSRDALPADLPANVRVAEYLPYDKLLPLVDVMVTNGGYGGVQQALAQGVPLVVAGQTEDKVEVSARVGWSGAGINLRTNTPSVAKVGSAVRAILGDPRYARRAHEIGIDIAAAPGIHGIDAVLHAVSRAGGLSAPRTGR